MLRKIGLLIVVSLLFLNALGEPGEKSEYRIVNAGIAHDKTSLCAMRDRYGFLWVGTLNGLVCYDGNGKSVYTSNSGVLPQTEGISVSSFFEKDDDIWFGGTQGLYIFHRDENRMERFPYKTRYNVQISSSVQRIVEGDDGRIWIITHGQGLFIFNPADVRSFKTVLTAQAIPICGRVATANCMQLHKTGICLCLMRMARYVAGCAFRILSRIRIRYQWR